MTKDHPGCEACAIADIEDKELQRLFEEAPLLVKLLPLAMRLRQRAGDLFNELGHNHGPLAFMPKLRERFRPAFMDQIADLLDS